VSKIDIKINQTKSVNKEIIHLTSRLETTESTLSSIRHQLDNKVRQQRGIGHRLNEAVTSLDSAEKKLKRIYQFIDRSMDLYDNAEKRVEGYKLGEVEKKKSWWEKIGNGVDTGKDIVKGFAKGVAEAVVTTGKGLWDTVTNPVETVKGLIYVVQNPSEVFKGSWASITESWKRDVIHGDASSRSQWVGQELGGLGLSLLGTKGVDRAVKLTNTTKVNKEIGGVRVVEKSDSRSNRVGNSVGYKFTASRIDNLDLTPKLTPFKSLSRAQQKKIKEKIENRTATKEEYNRYVWDKRFTKRRSIGVNEFWKQEKSRIINDEQFTRNWTIEQQQDILKGKKPKFMNQPIIGHHTYNAMNYPHVSNRGELIYPVTPNEHLYGWHGGNYHKNAPGKPVNPKFLEEF
jgi:hypothetical protein